MIGVQGIIPHMEINGKKKTFMTLFTMYTNEHSINRFI